MNRNVFIYTAATLAATTVILPDAAYDPPWAAKRWGRKYCVGRGTKDSRKTSPTFRITSYGTAVRKKKAKSR